MNYEQKPIQPKFLKTEKRKRKKRKNRKKKPQKKILENDEVIIEDK